MRVLTGLRTSPLTPDRLTEAARVLAQAFAAHPLHVAMFGRNALRRNREFFERRLRSEHAGRWLIAVDDERVVGVAHWTRDPRQLHSLERFGTVLLGPLAVLPERQRQGIGRILMTCFCDELDLHRESGVLETESAALVRFYRRFEFVPVHEADRHGIRQFTMVRPALIA